MSFIKATKTLMVMCLALLAVSLSHAQERMRAGNWENTVTAANGQTVTKNACVTAENAAMSNGSPASIRAEIEKALAKSGRCKLTDFKIDANSKTETMICGEDTFRNETTFHGGDSLETTTTRTKRGVSAVSHFKGRRTGDCHDN